MDFIEFCEYVLGHPLYDWQKTYLTKMYNMIKKAKEENREITVKATRSVCRTHVYAIWLISEYDKCLKGEKDD